MAESYRKIFPGNFVAHLNSYAFPNDDYKTNARPLGSPLDRCTQALLPFPGWLAVRKVGHARITDTAAAVFDITIPSPDLMADKPRVDIVGLHVPQGALCYRAGFRVLPLNAQPGYYSQGASAVSTSSGIAGTTGQKLVLASAVPAASGAAAISATAITTATDSGALVVASSAVPVGSRSVQTAFGSPVAITQSGGLTLQLHVTNAAVNATGTISSTFLGGCYVVAEVCYLVPEEVANLDFINIPGAAYSGVR